MNFDAPRKIKTPAYRCMNDGRFYQSHHEAGYFVFELAKRPCSGCIRVVALGPMPIS
jgi:hypothetical protein